MSEEIKPTKVQNTPKVKLPPNKLLKPKLLSNVRLLVPIVVILCAVVGGSYLLTKVLTSSYSLWSNNPIPKTITSADTSSIELGVKFESKNSGYVTGIRFYKSAQNTGVHTGSLWSSNGTLLARVTFNNEAGSGWQTATLIQPVNIAANVMYVVSYYAPNGHYSLSGNYFSDHQSHTSGPLTAFTDNSQSGANGVYIDSSTPKFPTQDMNGANFWVDLIFSTKLIAPPTAPAPPNIVTATQNGATIAVAWNAGISAKPIASYNILRNGAYYTNVSERTLTYTDSHIVAGRTYSYQIETVDKTSAVSAASVTASVTYNTTPAPTVTLSVSPASITAGSSTSLTWTSTNAIACQAVSPTAWTSSTAIFGSQVVYPTTTATYSLICYNNWGSISSSPVTIKVPPTVTLSVSPASITAGSSASLTWSSTNATFCQASSPAAWTSSRATSGSQSVSPTSTTTYTLTCNGSGGASSSSPVTVKVTSALSSSSVKPVGSAAGPWELVFDSEFNGSSLDTSQWSTGVDGAAGITGGYAYVLEQECYDPSQVNVSGGELTLTAINKSETCSTGTQLYTSGTVTTYNHFSHTYGYAEARIWLPGNGSIYDWPAFWELGKLYNVSKGEIDIVEGIAGKACATFHNSTSSPSFCSTATYTGGWHTFAADWEPGYINFYYDGTKVLSVTSGVTASPMYLVLDLALSTNITLPNTTPATMQVDYVRVWQHN
jgi:beta-glucanase (GH16 family)